MLDFHHLKTTSLNLFCLKLLEAHFYGISLKTFFNKRNTLIVMFINVDNSVAYVFSFSKCESKFQKQIHSSLYVSNVS